MRLKFAAPILASFALVACGSDSAEDGEPMSMDDVANEIASADTPVAGMYSSTQELLELDIPGLDDDMAAMMRAAFEDGATQETTYCLTEEQAANGREEMLAGMAESDCSITRFDMSGGEIDAALSCPTGQGVAGDVTLTGTMDSDSADMVMAFAADTPMGDATIRMRVQSQRVGECS